MLPDVVSIDGVAYIRDEVARERYGAKVKAPAEWAKVYDLSREFGVDVHRIYDAIRDGTLDARIPVGASRGRRVRRSDFVRWIEESWE